MDIYEVCEESGLQKCKNMVNSFDVDHKFNNFCLIVSLDKHISEFKQ